MHGECGRLKDYGYVSVPLKDMRERDLLVDGR